LFLTGTDDAKIIMKKFKKKQKKHKKQAIREDPSLLVSLGRAMALMGEVTACLNCMDRATSLLSKGTSGSREDEKDNDDGGDSSSSSSTSSSSSSSSSTLTFTPSGGRRAWKRGDEERAFAAAKFAEHRYRELGLEVAMIKKYVASLNSNNTTKASVAATLMKRVLTFPSGGRYTNNRSGALANLLSHGLMTKFGGNVLLNDNEQTATKNFYRKFLYSSQSFFQILQY
jgi:hypothetical protein